MAASPSPASHFTPILLRLYPLDWRARYEDELTGLLAESALTPSAVLDVVLAALDARLSGDYPSGAADGRKVRRPMLDRLAPVAIVLGSAFMTIFAVVVLVVGDTDATSDDPLITALFYGMPFAVGLLALGIGGVALGRLAGDPIARGLGLLTAVLGLAFAGFLFYLFFIDDIAWALADLVIPAFALSSGLLGLRLLLSSIGARIQGVLLAGGLVAAGAWAVGRVMTEMSPRVSVEETASLIQLLGFGVLFIGWLLVGLLELRGNAPEPVERVPAA